MNFKKILSLVIAGTMSFSVLTVSAMSMESDAMMKGDSMMKSDDAMMMKKDAMMKKEMMKTMTREERKMHRKEKAKMRAIARKMRWEEKAKMMKDQGMMERPGTMMKKDGEAMMKSGDAMKKDSMMKEEAMMKAGEYKDHTGLALPVSVLADGKTKVLFFHASWCPSCKAANQTLTSWYADGKGMLTVYKINYDTEKSLEQKYGVTYQHTFVKIDGQGKLIKLLQSPSDEDLKNFLKS